MAGSALSCGRLARLPMALAVAGVGIVALGGCSGGNTVANECGAPYTLHSPHGTAGLGDCGGMVDTTPSKLRIRVGQTFEIDAITDELSGTPGFQAPTTNDASVVARDSVSGRGGDGRYRAVGTGVAMLRVSSIYCHGGRLVTATRASKWPRRICPVLQVTVTS